VQKPQLLHSARGICFWYQGVRRARAAASCRYRIGHIVELTRGADVVRADKLPSSVARRAHTVVCVRPLVTPAVEQTLSELRRAGIRLVADYDDLLFAGDVSGLPASVKGSGGERKGRQQLARYAASLHSFDHFIVSTRALAVRLLTLHSAASVSVVPNGLSATWVAQGRALYPAYVDGDPLVIRYFSGSPSHDQDFSSILSPLNEFLEQNPEVALEIVGPLRLATKALPAARVSWRPTVRYEHLPQQLAATWVNLSPLATTEFNACKSAIKFLESGAFGCPTLASRSDDLSRHQELGAPVVLCDTQQDWYRELTVMLDMDRRRESGLSVMRYVAEHGMASEHANAWLRAISPSEHQ
jgi:hypothetical protein